MAEGEDTATAEPVVQDDTAKATVEETGHTAEATGTDGQVAGDQVAKVEETVDWESRYKAIQSDYTKKSMQLADLQKQAETNKTTELESKIASLEKQLSDPEALSGRLEAAQKRKEELEAMSPEQREVAQLRQRLDQMENNERIGRAQDTFISLQQKDPFFQKNEKAVIQLVATDNDLRALVLKDPQKGYRAIKGQLLDNYADEIRVDTEKQVKEDEAKKIELAKKSKTSMTAASTGGSGSARVEFKNDQELLDAFFKQKPHLRPASNW